MSLYVWLYSQEYNTTLEVKEAVVRYLKQKEILEQSLPSAIMIGPFTVNVEPVRKSLLKKCQALAKAVLDRLALKLHNQMAEASFTVFCFTRSQFHERLGLCELVNH